MRKKKGKRRKPIHDRQGGGAHRSATEDAIEGLVEFFTSASLNPPSPWSQPRRYSGVGQLIEPDDDYDPDSTPNLNDIQELEDMGALARDLIRRIQRLRDQFRPGSLAALALPDIRLEGDLEAVTAATPGAGAGPAVAHQGAPGHAGGQLEIMQENELMLDQPEMDDDDDDEHLLDGRDSSSE
jgi:hypothetical protein